MLLDALQDPELKAQALAAKPRVRAQSIHLILTVLAGAIISIALHRPIVMVMFLGIGWITSIFTFGIGPLPVWRIALIVAVQTLFLYLYYRFVLASFFG